jgi:hypothetical protein
MRQPIIGSGRPRECASARGGAKEGLDLAGDVTLEAADDLRLGFSLSCAAFGVGAGGGVLNSAPGNWRRGIRNLTAPSADDSSAET